jgi:hypothetical protein
VDAGQPPPRVRHLSTIEETDMKKLFVASLILSLSGAAFAADPSPAQAAQQSKMKSCNADAAGKKGDERKAFMKQCLSAKPAAAAAAEPKLTQQDKMKKCNADANGKKGDERKAFMKECLSSK